MKTTNAKKTTLAQKKFCMTSEQHTLLKIDSFDAGS